MLRPVGGRDLLPDDVERLATALRSELRVPRAGVDRARRPRPERRARRREFDDVDEMLEALDDDPLDQPPRDEEAAQLDRWNVRSHVYTSDVAGSVGILAGLFGLGSKRACAGAMHEAKRFRAEKAPGSGRPVEVGVAVRLIAATTKWEVDAEVSVSNLAAAAQLNANVGDARIGIEVIGYSGPLGNLLPAPSQLNVSTLVDYLSAFHAVQQQVFGRSGLAFPTPTVLHYEDDQS